MLAHKLSGQSFIVSPRWFGRLGRVPLIMKFALNRKLSNQKGIIAQCQQ
jgi:hypothetical protein